MSRRRSERIGRAKGSRGCGSSRSGSATRRLSSPTAPRSRLSSAGSRKWSLRTTSRPAVSCGRTGGRASSSKPMGGDGPRATPTYHDGRIYALGALGELRCLIARTGAIVWRRNILVENDAANLTWGMSAAPLIVDENVVVLPGGSRGQVGRRLQQADRRAGVEGARRSSGVHLAHARHARWRAPDSGRERVPGDGPDHR